LDDARPAKLAQSPVRKHREHYLRKDLEQLKFLAKLENCPHCSTVTPSAGDNCQGQEIL
jgi:hypothetical protein